MQDKLEIAVTVSKPTLGEIVVEKPQVKAKFEVSKPTLGEIKQQSED